MNITDGKRVYTPEDEDGRVFNQARRLYDRLRKRSYRRIDKLDKHTQHPSYPYWDVMDHVAYVRGVKDTLNELLGSDFE